MENFKERPAPAFEKIDRKSPELLDALRNAPLYRKFGNEKARLAVVGEKIVTVLPDGTEETENIAKEGDRVITNPSGEEYLLSETEFLSRYKNTEQEGVYKAEGLVRAIKNPYGKPIEVMAAWGSPEYGDANCYIADTCDAAGNMHGEPYLIDAAAFEATYLKA